MRLTPATFRAPFLGLAVSALASGALAGTGVSGPFCDDHQAVPTWNSTLTVPKFNTSLGTLLGATIRVTTDYDLDFTVTNTSGSTQDVTVLVGGTVTILCPSGSGNCFTAPNPDTNVFLQISDSQPFSYPGIPIAGTVSDVLTTGSTQTLTIPHPSYSLTLADFNGPGSLSFAVGAISSSNITTEPASHTERVNDLARVEICVSYLYDPGKDGPCVPNNEDVPGSLLLFPRYDSRDGHVTLITVTNTNCSFLPGKDGPLPEGTVDVEFVYVGRYADYPGDTSGSEIELPCLEANYTKRLTPCDTFTTTARAQHPSASRGFMYAFAKSPYTGEPIVFNRLIGQAVFIDGTIGDSVTNARDALNARTFLGYGGFPAADFDPSLPGGDAYAHEGAPTDLETPEGDGVRDLDGEEYSPAPDEILIPRYLGQGQTVQGGPNFESFLTLVNLSGGSLWDATVLFLIYDDSENQASLSHSFRCWDERKLVNLQAPGAGGVFTNEYLLSTSSSPLEILGAPGPAATRQKAGWFKIDGIEAHSTADSVTDPVIYAVLFERMGSYVVSDLPWELCTDPRGDLYEFGILFDDDPDTAP